MLTIKIKGDLVMAQLERIKTFSIEEVENMVKADATSCSCKKDCKDAEHSIRVEEHDVYTTSLRYKTFIEKGYKCVCCGRVGAYYALEKSKGQTKNRAHFNLYSDDDVLMTKDHILPKSKGGADCIENMQTMCAICNSAKGNIIPDGYVSLEVQKKEQSNREYIWFGDKKFRTLQKAVNVISHGNKAAMPNVKKRIREAIKNGTPYCGEIWRYGKAIS